MGRVSALYFCYNYQTTALILSQGFLCSCGALSSLWKLADKTPVGHSFGLVWHHAHTFGHTLSDCKRIAWYSELTLGIWWYKQGCEPQEFR